jgi:hypothetical protein
VFSGGDAGSGTAAEAGAGADGGAVCAAAGAAAIIPALTIVAKWRVMGVVLSSDGHL